MTAQGAPGRVSAMLSFCRELIGEYVVVSDHSWPHGESTVLELLDEAGRRWIAKSSRQAEQFQQEVTAYREWAPLLGDRVPRMLGHHETSHSILMTFEPGVISTSAGPAVHRQAGALIRRLHDAAPSRAAPDFKESLRERFERGVSSAGPLFSRHDLDFVCGRIADLDGIPDPVRVPAHQDNQPRNWLVSDEGVVRLIDFGLTRWDVWVRDLVRLHQWDWQHDPELEEAFLDGYGRRLSDDDQQVLRSVAAVTALMTVRWAHEHGDAAFAQRGWQALELARKAEK